MQFIDCVCFMVYSLSDARAASLKCKALKRHFVLVFTMDNFTQPYINIGVLFRVAFVEDDGQVVFPITSCIAFAIDTFDEQTLISTLHHLEILGLVLQRDLSHHLATFRLGFFWYLIGHHRRLGASTHRVLEGMDVAKADFSHEITAFLESRFCLAWEAHDDIGGKVEVWTEGLDPLAHVTELGDGVEAVHPFQGVVGAALQADVHVRG